MKSLLKTSLKATMKTLLLPAIAVTGMLASGQASAGDSYGYVGYDGGHGGGYYGGGHRWGGGRHHYRRGHHHGHGAANALLGFALGYTLFSAIESSKRPRYYDRRYERPYDPRYDSYGAYYGDDYYDRSYEYRQAEPYRYEPAPPRRNVVNPLASQQADMFANCLQTREYTTTIVIGGVERDAYGTACLQADGSWLQGAPKVVPNFD